jgi:hypothetical protein
MKLSRVLTIVSCAVTCIAGILFASLSLAGVVPEKEKALSVCALVQNATQYENRSVLVESTVLADEHASVLEGPGCGKGIYLSYAAGRSGGKWKTLDDALAAKSSGLDKRVLHVEIRGVYHSALQAYKRSIRQLEVTEVLDVRFEASMKPTGDITNKPSTETLVHESGHAEAPSQH